MKYVSMLSSDVCFGFYWLQVNLHTLLHSQFNCCITKTDIFMRIIKSFKRSCFLVIRSAFSLQRDLKRCRIRQTCIQGRSQAERKKRRKSSACPPKQPHTGEMKWHRPPRLLKQTLKNVHSLQRLSRRKQLLGHTSFRDGRGHVGLMRWKTNQLAAARLRLPLNGETSSAAAKELRGEEED